MVSLRDPVRDNLLFADFAQGVAAGCVLLAVASALDYERLLGKLSFVPLLASFALSALLIVFGYGPGIERRQGQPARLSAGGDHPHAAGALSGGLFRAALGRAAARARDRAPRLAALNAPLRYSAARIHPAGCWRAWRFRCCSSSCRRIWGRRWSSRCLFLALYGDGARQRFVPAAGLRCCCWADSWPDIWWACRTPSASASPCGFRRGTT